MSALQQALNDPVHPTGRSRAMYKSQVLEAA